MYLTRYTWGERLLKRTKNKWIINQAVYGKSSDRFYDFGLVSQNDNLTEEQCRYLYKTFDLIEEVAWREQLVRRSNFPSDLLRVLAMTETKDWILDLVIEHPNLDDEAKAILALRGEGDRPRANQFKGKWTAVPRQSLPLVRLRFRLPFGLRRKY